MPPLAWMWLVLPRLYILYSGVKPYRPRTYVLRGFIWSVVYIFSNVCYLEAEVLWWVGGNSVRQGGNRIWPVPPQLNTRKGSFSGISFSNVEQTFVVVVVKTLWLFQLLLWDLIRENVLHCLCTLHSWFDCMLIITVHDGNGGKAETEHTTKQQMLNSLH